MKDFSKKRFLPEVAKRLYDFRLRLRHDRVLSKGALWWFTLALWSFIVAGIVNVEIDKSLNPPQQMQVQGNVDASQQAVTSQTQTETSCYLTNTISLRVFYFALTFALFIGLLVGLCYKRKHPNRKACDGALDVYLSLPTKHDFASATILAVLIGTLCVLTLLITIDKINWLRWGKLILINPGGLFALITGAGTLIGTYIAIQSILEMKHTITTFSQLIERLTSLITDPDKDPDEGVCFLAFTPIPGAFNVNDKLVRRLKQALLDRNLKIRIACLNESDHDKWLSQFIGLKTQEKGEITKEICSTYKQECDDILASISGDIYYLDDNTTPKEKSTLCKHSPIRLLESELPGYYFFVSSARAIVVTPIQMPRIGNPDPDSGKSGSINVETLGFETTDRSIVRMLQNEFSRYAKWTLSIEEIVNFGSLASRLLARSDNMSDFLWSRLSNLSRSNLERFRITDSLEMHDKRVLVEELNNLLSSIPLYKDELIKDVTLRDCVRYHSNNPDRYELTRVNREILEEVYKTEIRPRIVSGPSGVRRFFYCKSQATEVT